jgi:uncharacterized protein
MLSSPIDLRILCGGQNWMSVGSLLAVGLDGYYSKLPQGSTVAAITADPGRMCMEGPGLVASGRYHMGITTPSWLVAMARAGQGPFKEPLPLCAIAVFPHDDRLALAVRAETGITSLSQIRDEHPSLNISMPIRELGHPARWVIDEILGQYGISEESIEAWGGKVLKDRPRSQNSPKAVPVDPTFDAVFDEAIMSLRWQRITESHEMRFLDVEPEPLAHCVSMGMKAGVIETGRLRGVTRDVPTVDFTGWVLYCSEDLPDELAYLTAAALDERADQISERFTGPTAGMTAPLDMAQVGLDLPVPLHPGAENYYREHSYL